MLYASAQIRHSFCTSAQVHHSFLRATFSTNEVLRVAGLQIIKVSEKLEYIQRKQNTVADYVATRLLLDICRGIEQTEGGRFKQTAVGSGDLEAKDRRRGR